MMSVPPSGGGSPKPSDNQGSNPNRPTQQRGGKSGKDFKLPKEPKKGKSKQGEGQKAGKKDDKKESPGGNVEAVGSKVGDKPPFFAAFGKEVTAATSAKGGTHIADVAKIITELVAKLASGKVGDSQLTSLDLKTHPGIPSAFAGANLSVTQTDAGVVVNFSNFTDASQQAEAVKLLQDNQEQLQQLVRSLSAKNINLTSMQVGNVSISLPRPDQVTPAQPVVPPQETYREQGDQGGQGQQGQDQGEPESEE